MPSSRPAPEGQSPVPGHADLTVTSEKKPRREPPRWNVSVTVAILLVGVFDVGSSLGRYADLGATLRQLYDEQGFGTFTLDQLADQLGLVINIARVSLLVLAIALALWRLACHRTAFWIPLVGGIVAGVVTVGLLIAVMVTDPAFAQYVTRV